MKRSHLCFKRPGTRVLLTLLVVASLVPTVRAEPLILMTAADGNGTTTSFNGPGNWSDALAPFAGNNYFNSTFLMRSPDTTGMSYTFGGDSLAIGAGNFLGKSLGTETLIVNDLILTNGSIYQGNNTGDSFVMTLGGNMQVYGTSGLGANGATIQPPESLVVTATISGSAPASIAIGPTGSQNEGFVTFNAANPFSGTILLSAPYNGHYTSTTYGGLVLSNLNAVEDATVSETSTSVNPLSFGAMVNTGPFNIGALGGSTAQRLLDTSGSAVTVNVGGNNANTTYSGVLSGAGGALTKSGAGTMILSGANTYTGVTTINGGELEADHAETAGTSGPFGDSAAVKPGSIVFGGGALAYSSVNVVDYSSRFSTAAGQPYSIDVNGRSLTFNTALDSSGGSLTLTNASGSGSLTLPLAETYSGATTINGGALIISSSGSINNSTSISIGAGGTLDVSAFSTYTASSTAFSASGTGTSSTTAANLKGATAVDLGSQPISLTIAPASFSGDLTHPALYVSQSALNLSGNTISINNAAATPLGAGVYRLIQVGNGSSGTLNGNPSLPVSVPVTGTGLAPNSMAFLTIDSANVDLVVCATSIAISSTENPSGFHDSVSFTATYETNGVAADNATGEMVFLTNGVPLSTITLVNASATSAATTFLPRGIDTITATYAGDSNYGGGTNTLDQEVTNHPPVAATFSVTRTAGLNLHIFVTSMATNWSDVDGDTVTLSAVDLMSTNNVTVLTNSTQIFYPGTAPSVSDQISYTISDGQGGTSTGLINVLINPFVTGQQTPALAVTEGSVTASFYGIPAYVYEVQRSTNLDSGSGWVNISTNTVGSDGVITVNDTFPDLGGQVPASAYYRLEWDGNSD